jgi:hypothetical protein
MNEHSRSMTGAPASARFDRPAIWSAAALAVLFVTLAGVMVYGRAGGQGWLGRVFLQRWPVVLGGTLIAVLALSLFDLTRQKNVVWRAIRRRYGARPAGARPGKNYGAGRGRVGRYSYLGLRCFGYPDGLAVVRLLSIVNRPLFVPWSAVSAVEAYPNVLTGKVGFENDMEAKIVLRDEPTLMVEVPWLGEYRQLLPKAVRFRSTKRPEKAGPSKRAKR